MARVVLRLHDQQLTALPTPLDSELTSLQLPGNRFGNLPDELRTLPQLTDLNMASNGIVALEPSILAGLGGTLKALTLTDNALTCLPEEVGALERLELLAAGRNALSGLPAQVGRCRSLRSLTLSENTLTALPHEIGQLTMLRTLRLDHNPGLTALPDALCQLAVLEALSVIGCGLRSLPHALGCLAALSTLQAKDNRLTTVPDSIGNLQRLRTLILEGNRIEAIPAALGGCAFLRVLALSVNSVRHLPESFSRLTALHELRLDDNPLVALPEGGLPPALRLLGLSVCSAVSSLPGSIGQLANLEQLAVGAARLRRLPDTFCEVATSAASAGSDALAVTTASPICGSLRILQLSGNVMNVLPRNLGNLTSLRTLEVSDNRLEALPESIGNLASLETLRAGENRLTYLPESIGGVRTLQILGLGANHLTSLPAAIGSLPRLHTLELHSNLLARLPDELGSATALRRLLLDDNNLSELPASLACLSQLEELGLACNRLTSLPPALLDAAGHPAAHDSSTDGSTKLEDLSAAAEGASGAERPPKVSTLSKGGLRALCQLRVHSNRLTAPPAPSVAPWVTLFDNPCHGVAGVVKPRVALLLPGLVRNYAHGRHWRRFVECLSPVYNVKVYLCLWTIKGSVANNFAQSADKAESEPIDLDYLRDAYPPAAAVELVPPAELWVDKDKEGFDGRYLNQWRMIARCWELMERSAGAGAYDYVIRSRPDLRVACLPLRLEAKPTPYLAMQERLWGSDCFFFGDYASMRSVCAELAPRYDEYTAKLGQASSEPMLRAHLQSAGLEDILVRFARCCSVDRT